MRLETESVTKETTLVPESILSCKVPHDMTLLTPHEPSDPGINTMISKEHGQASDTQSRAAPENQWLA